MAYQLSIDSIGNATTACFMQVFQAELQLRLGVDGFTEELQIEAAQIGLLAYWDLRDAVSAHNRSEHVSVLYLQPESV